MLHAEAHKALAPSVLDWKLAFMIIRTLQADGRDGGGVDPEATGSAGVQFRCKCLIRKGLRMSFGAVNIRTVSHEWFL